MNAYLMVMAGGAVGSGLRYFVSISAKSIGLQASIGTGFVNILGSFLIGVAFAVFVVRNSSSEYALFIITGLLGGFTTFSAFSIEMMQFAVNGKFAIALIYAVLSVVIGLLAAYVGYAITLKL